MSFTRSKSLSASASLLHRRGRSFNGRAGDDSGDAQDSILNLDLFSNASVNGSLENEKRGGIDDLLDSTEMGKHDYDWLLTPPGTPHLPPSDAVANENPSAASCNEKHSTVVAPKRNLPVRSLSTTRTLRLSAAQTENGVSARPTRSSSVTRGSISSSRVANNRGSNVLSTSSASVTSRPSTPGKRPTTPSSKASTLASPAVSRSSTPVKARPNTSSGTRTGPPENARPATPNSRSRMSTNSTISSSTVIRPTSRPSTPTRQPISRVAAPGKTIGCSPSVGRIPSSNTRTPQSAPSSRASSPSPRPRTPVRPIDLPDFPNDAPPNLRTKLPERPLSAGRARPGALTVRATPNAEPTGLASSNRRTSFPVFARSKFPENPSRVLSQSNGNHPEKQKTMFSDIASPKTTKSANTTESTGFGRTISKSSIDMAVRHMDIRQSLCVFRGATLFPQSIRTAPSNARATRTLEPVVPASNDDISSESDSCNDTASGDANGVSLYETNSISKSLDREIFMDGGESFNDLDLYGSYRYDSMLMKEDPKNTNWLHSVDDNSDQSSVFDHRFEPLPELFDPL